MSSPQKLFCHGRNQLSLLKNVAAHFAAHGWAQVTTGDGKEEADDLVRVLSRSPDEARLGAGRHREGCEKVVMMLLPQ